jgi:phosphonopyruvate decarboxylase
MSESRMQVSDVARVVLSERGDAMGVVTMSALGWWEARRDDYRLIGLMGSAGAIGLGLALGQPRRRVWVIDGDGSLLMQLGILPAIGASGATNLLHLIVDNGIYAVSGAQPVPGPRDWEQLLRGAGMRHVSCASTPDELRAALTADAEGPRAVVARCVRERPAYPAGAFDIDAAAEAARVRAALGEAAPPVGAVSTAGREATGGA